MRIQPLRALVPTAAFLTAAFLTAVATASGSATVLAQDGATQITSPEPIVEELLQHAPTSAVMMVRSPRGENVVRALESWVLPLPSTLPPTTRSKIMGGLLLARFALGTSPANAVAELLEGRFAAAAFPPEPKNGSGQLGWSMVFEAADEGRVEGWLEQLRKSVEVRRVETASANSKNHQLVYAASNTTLLDEAIEHGAAWWESMPAPAANATAEAHVAVDLAGLRKLRLIEPNGAIAGLEDGPSKWLLGPLAEILDASETMLGILRFTTSAESSAPHQELELALDFPPMDAEPRFASLRASAASEQATQPAAAILPMLEGELGRFVLDRSLDQALTDPARWFGEEAALSASAELSAANVLLGPGKSIHRDLVAPLGEPLSWFVLSPPKLTKDEERPVLRYPQGVLVAHIAEDRDDYERVLNATASNFATVIQVERKDAGEASFVVRTLNDQGVRGLYAEFSDSNNPEHGPPPSESELTPCVAITGRHLLIASTVDAAMSMANALRANSAAISRVEPLDGLDELRFQGPQIAAYLAEIEDFLVLGRRLDTGETKVEATTMVRTIAAVVGALGEVSVRATAIESGLQIVLHAGRSDR